MFDPVTVVVVVTIVAAVVLGWIAADIATQGRDGSDTETIPYGLPADRQPGCYQCNMDDPHQVHVLEVTTDLMAHVEPERRGGRHRPENVCYVDATYRPVVNPRFARYLAASTPERGR